MDAYSRASNRRLLGKCCLMATAFGARVGLGAHFLLEKKFVFLLYRQNSIRILCWGVFLKGRVEMRVLFIGNSHTYFNDMPNMFAELARKEGVACEVTMLAHGGWYLEQHQAEPETRFNILYGHYDYVVLQEHAHPFGPAEKMWNAAEAINAWIREAGSVPVCYMTWAQKDAEDQQKPMTDAYGRMADKLNAILAPVGEEWWKYIHEHQETEMYAADGAHASLEGSLLAAQVIWREIKKHRDNIVRNEK